MQEPFIQERRAALDLFLRKMSEVPVLYNSRKKLFHSILILCLRGVSSVLEVSWIQFY